MTTSPFGAGLLPESKQSEAGDAADPREVIGLSLYENANPDAQREVLDGLPVLVFL